jgi:hypothetical protein
MPGAHVASARRALGKVEDAEDALALARGLWEAGAPGDPGLLEATRELVNRPPETSAARPAEPPC